MTGNKFITLTPEQERKAIEGIRQIGMPGEKFRPIAGPKVVIIDPSPDGPTIQLRQLERAFLESTPETRKRHYEEFMAHRLCDPVGPTGKTIALCLSTATDGQLTRAMAAIQKEVIARSIVTSHAKMPPRQGMSYQMLEQEIAALLEEKGEELAEHLDRREAEKMQPLSDESWLDMLEGKLQIEPVQGEGKVSPYLQEGIHIPSCPVIGKQAPEAIDLSEESI
ncbi:MAG: hypothetical protein ACRCXB_23525 [Aeromonadaceae bacterium]